MTIVSRLLALSILSGPLLSSVSWAAPHPLAQQVTAVADYLTRPMETQLPGRTVRVRMTTCPIQINPQTSPPGTVFLYQEQALTNQLNQPYRQRFMAIEADADQQRVVVRSFKPPFPRAWSGFCSRSQQAHRSAAQPPLPAAVLREEVCQVSLRQDPERSDRYTGSTPSAGCPTTFRGAVRITNTITLDPSGMETWDRGFDATGQQLWGAKQQGYRFRPIAPHADQPPLNDG